MKKIYILLLAPLFFSSCNPLDSIGMTELIIIFVVIILLFLGAFFYIAKKKKEANMSLASFSNDIQNMLNRINNPQDKITALKQLIVRIENDEKYKKTPDWKGNVLAKVYEHMATVYYKIDDETGMLEACTQVITYDPSHAMSYYNRGSIYSNRKQNDKALADFNDTILLLPYYANAYNNRGLVYDRMGEPEKALVDFNKAIELEPTAIAYYNRANLHFKTDRLQEARLDYEKYIELDPKDEIKLTKYVSDALDTIDKKSGKR